jgi:peptidoglycan/xylan/chitin deacetylase (PgdA/CDA1 family)
MKKFYSTFLVMIFALLFLSSSSLAGQSFEDNSPPDLLKDFAILREKINRNPRDVASLNSMGIIYAKSGRLDDAVRLWKYALDIDPRYIHLYNNLGSALKQLGRRSEARLIFQTGLQLSNSYWIYYNLGLLEKEEGNVVAASNCFKRCLQINPSFQQATRKLAELGHNVQLPAMDKTVKPMTLGSYKPPVAFGNIDLYPLYPNGSWPENQAKQNYPSIYGKGGKNNLKGSFTPLTVASCSEIIKSFKASGKDKYIALTFDDGPHGTYTPQILDILNKNAVKATFFIVGTRAETYPEIVSQASQAGHAIGNHSWNHKSLAKLSTLAGLESLNKTNELISGLTGTTCYIVRPPFGHTSQRVKQMIHKQGWHEIMWDSDSRDWENKNPDHILFKVMKSIAPGSIILFHDIHPGAAGMLQTLITACKNNGYRFITIPELIEIAAGTS